MLAKTQYHRILELMPLDPADTTPISEAYDEAIRRARQSALLTYSAAGTHWQKPTWRALALCDELGFPQLLPHRDDLIQWARTQRLTPDTPFPSEDWCAEVILATLLDWRGTALDCGFNPLDPPKGLLWWFVPGVTTIEPYIPPPPAIDFPQPHPLFHELAVWEREYVASVTAATREYRKWVAEVMINAGRVEAPVKYQVRHFRWLAEYQYGRSTFGELAAANGMARQSITDAVKGAAAFIGLELRQRDRGGHPRRHSALEE